jgi:hypothetical protein
MGAELELDSERYTNNRKGKSKRAGKPPALQRQLQEHRQDCLPHRGIIIAQSGTVFGVPPSHSCYADFPVSAENIGR